MLAAADITAPPTIQFQAPHPRARVSRPARGSRSSCNDPEQPHDKAAEPSSSPNRRIGIVSARGHAGYVRDTDEIRSAAGATLHLATLASTELQPARMSRTAPKIGQGLVRMFRLQQADKADPTI